MIMSACLAGLLLGDTGYVSAFFGSKDAPTGTPDTQFGLKSNVTELPPSTPPPDGSRRQPEPAQPSQQPAIQSDSDVAPVRPPTVPTVPAATPAVQQPPFISPPPVVNAPATNYFVPVAATTQPNLQPSAVVLPPAVTPPPQPVVAKKPGVKAGDVSFNFDDADVFSVIQTIFGDVLRVNYIVDPNVKGRVNFRSVAPIAKDDVLPLMEVILRLNGIGIVEEGGLYRIIPIADLSKEPSPVSIGRESGKVTITGKALVQVVPVLYSQSGELTRVLTPFLSKSAVIIDVPKSNYIIIVDTDANVKRLLQLVEIFDSETLKQVTPQVFVYPVQNSKAKDVASLLQQIFLGARSSSTSPKPATTRPGSTPQPAVQPVAPSSQPQVIAGGQASGDLMVAEGTKVIADETTNSVIILASPDDYLLIYNTITKIDIAPRQVMIEGLIVQVTLTDNLNFGLSYSMNTDLRITGLNPFKNGINLLSNPNNTTGNLGVNTSTFGNIPTDGFTFVGYDPTGNIRAVLNALEKGSRAKVVAAPHILVTDNKEARIQVGQQIPLATSTMSQITATATTTGTATTNTPVYGTSTVQYKDIGIILKVKPQVNDSGLISLELTQEISSVGDKVQVGGLDEVSINKTEVTSTMVARDGETIVIGGLIREDTTKGSAGIPFLSKIPLLGALFGNTTDTTTRNELIILLTPHVARNLEEAKGITSDYIDRYKKGAKDKEIDRFIEERGGLKKEKKATDADLKGDGTGK